MPDKKMWVFDKSCGCPKKGGVVTSVDAAAPTSQLDEAESDISCKSTRYVADPKYAEAFIKHSIIK